MEQNSTKYLRVTIHDNDYRGSLKLVCDMLYEIFWMYGYPTEEDFPRLKECIKHIWFGTHNAIILLDRGGHTDNIKYFNPHLEFVDVFDIPDWDNAESAYIPMFDDAEVLHR